MNAFFALAQGAATAAFIVAAYLVIPRKIWGLLPPEIEAHRKQVVTAIVVMVFLVVTTSAIMAYGPVIDVDAAVIPAAPDRKTVTTKTEFIEPSDRIGQFDEKIKDKPLPSGGGN